MKCIGIGERRNTSIIVPFLVMSLLIMALSACGPSAPVETSQVASPPETAISTDQTQPTESPKASVGMSRSNPIPYSTSIISIPNWDIQILELVRGEDALVVLEAANGFRPSSKYLPDDREILLLKLHVKSKHTDNREHTANFQFTGDRQVWYGPHIPVSMPKPQINEEEVSNGGETEGWTGVMIPKGEGSLLLINSEFGFPTSYIALEEGASVGVPAGLNNIQPTDSGKDQANPALRTDMTVTEDWEISIPEVFRGDEALQKLKEASPSNRPAKNDMEYILLKVHVRYIGTKDEVTPQLDFNSFKLTGSQNSLYDAPSFMDVRTPEPFLQVQLFPGGEYEGWLVMQAAQGETGLILVFDPEFDSSGQNKMFISLEP